MHAHKAAVARSPLQQVTLPDAGDAGHGLFLNKWFGISEIRVGGLERLQNDDIHTHREHAIWVATFACSVSRYPMYACTCGSGVSAVGLGVVASCGTMAC